LETGSIVPADIRLCESANLKIQESSLTGESVAVEKTNEKILDDDIALGDQLNMAFSSGYGDLWSRQRNRRCDWNADSGWANCKFAAKYRRDENTDEHKTRKTGESFRNWRFTYLYLNICCRYFIWQFCP
jgi:hypothetical protein